MFNLKKLFQRKQTVDQVRLDLSKLSPEKLQEVMEAFQSGGVITIPQDATNTQKLTVEPLGDGKAVFMDEGYEEEAKELEHEKTGLKGWYDRLKRL